MWFVIPYYHKIFIFAVERWLMYDCETECSFVYLIFAVLLNKINNVDPKPPKGGSKTQSVQNLNNNLRYLQIGTSVTINHQ